MSDQIKTKGINSKITNFPEFVELWFEKLIELERSSTKRRFLARCKIIAICIAKGMSYVEIEELYSEDVLTSCEIRSLGHSIKNNLREDIGIGFILESYHIFCSENIEKDVIDRLIEISRRKCILCNKWMEFSHFRDKAFEQGLGEEAIKAIWANKPIKNVKLEFPILCCKCITKYSRFNQAIESNREICFVCRSVFKCKRKEKYVTASGEIAVWDEGPAIQGVEGYLRQKIRNNLEMVSRQWKDQQTPKIIARSGYCDNFRTLKFLSFDKRIKRLRKILVLKKPRIEKNLGNIVGPVRENQHSYF